MFTQQVISPSNNWDLNGYSQITGLSPMQIQQLQLAFNQESAATGGRMTISQFKSVYAKIAGISLNFNADAERVFLMFDTDGNGVLTFDEFLMAYLMLQRGTNPAQRWTYALNSYPVSRPGYLSQQEAQLALNSMQRFYNFPHQESYLSTAWSQLGGGANGYVPTSEFVQTVVPMIPEDYVW